MVVSRPGVAIQRGKSGSSSYSEMSSVPRYRTWRRRRRGDVAGRGSRWRSSRTRRSAVEWVVRERQPPDIISETEKVRVENLEEVALGREEVEEGILSDDGGAVGPRQLAINQRSPRKGRADDEADQECRPEGVRPAGGIPPSDTGSRGRRSRKVTKGEGRGRSA